MRPSLTVVLFCAVLASSAAAKEKTKNLSIWMTQVGGCDAVFLVTQEPSPFLTDLVEVKDEGVVKFRRNGEYLEKFPDDITLRIEYRRAVAGLLNAPNPSQPTKPCEPIDPAGIKFRAMWKNESRTAVADGVVLQENDLGAETLCELTCSHLWVYQLLIESRDVPLTDDLVIEINSPEGKHLAKLVGGLGSLEHITNVVGP